MCEVGLRDVVCTQLFEQVGFVHVSSFAQIILRLQVTIPYELSLIVGKLIHCCSRVYPVLLGTPHQKVKISLVTHCVGLRRRGGSQ